MLLVDETQILISGQAHARYPYGVAYRSPPPTYRRPNRRPNYACCRNRNETVALFCKVNAKRWRPEEDVELYVIVFKYRYLISV